MPRSFVDLSELYAMLSRVLRFQIVLAIGFVMGPWLQCEALAQPAGGVPTNTSEGTSSREAKENAIRSIPFAQLTPDASQKLRGVIEDASFFRRMPTQTVDCDPQMFAFLVRHPEVVVSIWDTMGITKVSLQRTDEYKLSGNDGAGTTCNMDLVYGSDSLHIYHSNGVYSGNLWARELRGRCVVVLHNKPGKLPDGRMGMVAWMDAFMKLENVGADLVVKTLGPLVGKTADHNFVECAGFFTQISQTAQQNPHGFQQLVKRLNGLNPKTREEFINTGMAVAIRANKVLTAQQALASGVAKSSSSNGTDKANPADKEEQPQGRLSLAPVELPSLDKPISTQRIVLPSGTPEASARRTLSDKPENGSTKEKSESPTIQILNSESKPR